MRLGGPAMLYNTFSIIVCIVEDRDSSVGIANRYELDGPGIESR